MNKYYIKYDLWNPYIYSMNPKLENWGKLFQIYCLEASSYGEIYLEKHAIGIDNPRTVIKLLILTGYAK